MHRPSAQALYSNRTARTIHNNLLLSRRGSSQRLVVLGLLVFFFCSTLLLSWSLFYVDEEVNNPAVPQKKLVKRVAFGSSSAHDYSSQPVWVNGVIPSDPDVWIWLGNMAYLDEPRVNCEALPSHAQCNCSANWLQQPPSYCMAGNLEHAASRMEAQLANPDYAQFLAFMCPGHRERGLFPPSGSDPSVCPRKIYGTYADHDYSWKEGNKRLPQKDVLKQIFLDALGEAPDSPRRNHGRGIHWKYTLNEGSGLKTEVILLDTRYYRDPLPCYIRRRFCDDVLRTNSSHEQYSWCLDFLHGGEDAQGSCCKRDELILHEWCSQQQNTKICDPSSPSFTELASEVLGELYSSFPNASFCEMLGSDQRNWLEDVLVHSDAPIKLLVSSSPVLTQSVNCLGDDWECYKPAKVNLLKLASGTSGLVVILSGTTEYSDIQVLQSGSTYMDVEFSYPLFQITAGGLTATIGRNASCEATDKGCSFVKEPSFGMIEIGAHRLKLQIRDGINGKVSRESELSLP